MSTYWFQVYQYASLSLQELVSENLIYKRPNRRLLQYMQTKNTKVLVPWDKILTLKMHFQFGLSFIEMTKFACAVHT